MPKRSSIKTQYQYSKKTGLSREAQKGEWRVNSHFCESSKWARIWGHVVDFSELAKMRVITVLLPYRCLLLSCLCTRCPCAVGLIVVLQASQWRTTLLNIYWIVQSRLSSHWLDAIRQRDGSETYLENRKTRTLTDRQRDRQTHREIHYKKTSNPGSFGRLAKMRVTRHSPSPVQTTRLSHSYKLQ